MKVRDHVSPKGKAVKVYTLTPLGKEMAGKAMRTGDKIDIQLEVTEGAGDDMKLRLLVVEESIRYVGGNQMRFHHHVVRAMPGRA